MDEFLPGFSHQAAVGGKMRPEDTGILPPFRGHRFVRGIRIQKRKVGFGMSAQQTHRFEYQLHLTFLFYVVFKIKF
jgi:hypothetical protein